MNLRFINTDRNSFPALTGIRAVAAFMVFFTHIPICFSTPFLMQIEKTGYTGVTVFFVLSGFLITYKYLPGFKWRRGWWRSYIVKRFARIYPVYFLVLTAVVLSGNKFDSVYLLQNYTLTQSLSFLFESNGIAIVPAWSLTVEECFYILAPLTFWLLNKGKGLYAYIITVFFFLLIVLKQCRGGCSFDKMQLLFEFNYFGRCFEFFAGAFLAVFVLKGKKLKSFTSPVYTTLGLLSYIAGLLVIALTSTKESEIRCTAHILITNYSLPVSLLFFYYGLINERTMISKALSSGAMIFSGKVSYAFYLLHAPVAVWAVSLGYQHKDNNGHVIVLLLVTYTLASLLYLFYELPLNNKIRKLA